MRRLTRVGAPALPPAEAPAQAPRFALRILNPDGSEAEKSGNGLRIFSRYLWDKGRVGEETFLVVTRGGTVRCQVRNGGRAVFIEMGTARFDSELIPVLGPRREVVGEEIEAGGERLRITAVTMGNPHCVVHVDEVSASSRATSARRSSATPSSPRAPTSSSARCSSHTASRSRSGSAAPATRSPPAAAAAPPPRPRSAWDTAPPAS